MNIRELIINKLKTPLADYNENYQKLLDTGQEIESTLQSDTEILSEIRRKFDNLSATVELEFEGTSVFDQEIKKAKELLQQGIAKVNESASISSLINDDLNNISNILQKIHNEGIQLEDLIKNINIVTESIEVASRNAGITAFHAGKKGRGFEVIAREMTGLVRSSQKPTEMIPKISGEIINDLVELRSDLKKIGDIIIYLKGIAEKFTSIINELLSFIPEIEFGIKGISESIATQKELHNILLKENEKLTSRLDDVYDTARSSSVIEIFLAALFQQINNIKDELLKVQDNASFIHIHNSFKKVLCGATKKEEHIIKELSIEKLETQSSDRMILQFVSEANHLNQIIQGIAHQIKNWSKTNNLAADALSKGVIFYQDILDILEALNKKINSIKQLTGEVAQPLKNLKKITDRSRILGLYAGIESARGGEYASSLGVVTKEIKNLSQKTADFVVKIGEIETLMLKDFIQINTYLIKSLSDVEQGIASLKLAIAAATENRKVLENLDNLAKEMVDSITGMVSQCRVLGDKIKSFSEDYKKIGNDFTQYVDSIHSSAEASGQILNVLNQYEKDVLVLERKTKTIVFRDTTDPIILDPANKTDATSHQIIEQLFIGLLTFDSSGHLIPGIAESLSVSKDGRQWDFSIKKAVKFHNGETATANDVVNSMRRVKNGPNANFIDYIDELIVLDGNRVRFILKYPYLPFLANLACGVCDIIPQNFSPENPVGCGPYRFVHWEKNKEIVLAAFEDFFDGRPVIDQVIIKIVPDDNEALTLFRKGEISLMEASANMINELRPEEILSGSVLSTQYIGINVQMDSPFKDKRVRQAMNYAIDKDYYAKVLMQNQTIPGYGIFPPGIAVYNQNLSGYHFDLKKAMDLMREAGYPGGIDATFPFDIRDGKEALKRAEFIKNSLEKIGINLILNPLSWKDLLERSYNGESFLSMKGWVSDNGDPDNFLYPLFHSRSFGRPGNTSFYANKEVDEMIESSRYERNSKRRAEMYQRIEQVLVEDAPWIFLSYGLDFYAVQKNIAGFKIDPFGIVRFRNLWCW